MSSRGMDAEKSSLCNFVVDFLLRENYLLTAFELLHELVEDGRHDQAIRLRDFFSDSSVFPPDQIARYNSLRVADPQCLLEEKETLQEKLAFSEYELRLAQEDILKLKEELQKKTQHSSSETDGFPTNHSSVYEGKMGNQGISVDLGSLKDEERQVLNCAVKEYLMIAGYRLTAMTFYEEVADQNLDIWPKSPASVTDALRHYFYQYLSSTTDAAEEKISILQERDRLLEEIEHLKFEKESLLKSNGLAETQLSSLTRLLETAQKEIKDKDILKSLEFQRKDLNDCRAEITSLKMYIESSRAGQHWVGDRTEQAQPRVNEESSILREAESSKKDQVSDEQEDITAASKSAITEEDVCHDNSNAFQTHSDDLMNSPVVTPEPQVISCNENGDFETRNGSYEYHSIPSADTNAGKPGLEAIHILSDALPKIVPYVLINHREELLPLIMCAIERHPESGQRDLLTHTLFNLIKRPDEQQRRIIMDACVILAKNVGEMRTETELLPQCWEQINHKYEERRLLVAQSCGQLAEFVRPEIRDSLILSIVQQLVEDPSAIVRQAASHNLALLLPCFPNVDKYFKVEELAYQLLCDPSGLVVETSLKELIPSLINWGNNLDHLVRVSLSHLLSSAERCPPLSGVEISVESHLRFLGERERWNIEVLLRMLTEVIPFIYAEAVKTCPFVDEALASPQAGKSFFSPPLLDMYARGHADWPSLDWLHAECVPDLIRLSCFLPTREDHLRAHIRKFLLGLADSFGDEYVIRMLLPIFLEAVGDNADLTVFPKRLLPRIKGLQPKTAVSERLAVLCILPLLLGGVLGTPNRHEQFAQYLRKLLVQNPDDASSRSLYHHSTDLYDCIRFLSMFNEQHTVILNILWEMVVSTSTNMKISAVNLLKILVPYVDVKVASGHILPALVTLGSDQNIDVKYATIDAFGIVAQHFKSDAIVEKMRIQMDAFLEDGSHEATIAVVRALCLAVPHTSEKLQDYLLSKIFQLTNAPTKADNLMRRCERANAFCEALRALDATDLPGTSTKEMLVPAIQNLLKDGEALDPAHKEALEVILRERSGGALSMAMGIASSVGSLFGDGGLLVGKKLDAGEIQESSATSPAASVQEDTRFRRIMRGNFGDMLRPRGKAADESPQG
ncbi:HEAT repeat-containing protein isoform X2 [Wolffia australiana]